MRLENPAPRGGGRLAAKGCPDCPDFKERCAAAAYELTARYMRQPHYWMVVSRDVSRVEP
jgi:hypothetical protein